MLAVWKSLEWLYSTLIAIYFTFSNSGFISLLVLTAIGCGVQSFCRKNGSDDDIYSLGYGGTSASYHRNDRWLIVAKLVTPKLKIWKIN